MVTDVCAKAVVLDAPKGGIDSSENEESNPIQSNQIPTSQGSRWGKRKIICQDLEGNP